MDKRELKARVDAQMDEWKRNLDLMRAHADAATGDAKVRYREELVDLQQRYDQFKIQAAKSWDEKDDAWEATSKDLELTWDEWKLRAKRAYDELTTPTSAKR